MQGKSRKHEGITVRRNADGTMGYQAHVWSARDNKRIRKTFPTLAAAKSWRRDALSALANGKMRAPSQTTLREAVEAWLEGAKAGIIRNRKEKVYKPSVLRGYEAGLNLHVLPALGARSVSEVERRDLKALSNRMLSDGLDPSTIRNAINPVRALYRHLVDEETVHVNPTIGLSLPAEKGRRTRIAPPDEAASLLAVLPDEERGVWATAFYSGLRVGELFALRWENVDFEKGIIRVERAYDPKERQFIDVKSTASERNVPIPAVLRLALREHQVLTGRRDGLVFGSDGEKPFGYQAHRRHALSAWKRAKLVPIGFHEARHTFASLMIAAGVNIKAISTYMGHASITITLDRYGHLLPGSEADAAEKLDAYLALAQ